MNVWTFKGGFDENLTYVFSDGNSPDAAIVDASVPLSKLQPTIVQQKLSPTKLLITHSHFDHTAYLGEYTASFPQAEVCVMTGSGQLQNEQAINDYDEIQVGTLKVTVFHTPGHTQNSVCFFVKGVLFSGDTIFIGRTGRTISTGSDTRDLYHSITRKILTLPATTKIYPGHDYGPVQTMTLEENIEISPLLQASDEQDFVIKMEEYERSR